ncbi:MAG TPA: L7Ae/L30e/S12e/Gadd45 family ribosomal protein [Gemmatimonadaceae bacterium]|jgi:ribosomal protein L7Ae-like RNA K-turn-binding protein|nr:L7Ae/L30e/S12e/Gadd45 family ribosomal protein [Gemmatimonadaceae bacterium]
MDSAQLRKLLGLVGLGVRGRGAIVGVQQVREAARRGKLHLAIAAKDASGNSLDKVLPLLKARGIPVFVGPDAAELGSAAGRETVAVIGIVDNGLAKGIRALSPDLMPDIRVDRGERV